MAQNRRLSAGISCRYFIISKPPATDEALALVPRPAFRFHRALPPILLALAVALAPTRAPAQRKKEERSTLQPTPPQPVEQTVKVRRGGKVEIPLRIYGRQGERVRFLIRSRPEHGKLSEPAAVANDAATVTYEPPTDLTVTGDRFTFAAGSALGVSAAAAVAITIIDDPPLLIVPDAVEFSAVLAGEKTVQEIEIVNEGGGLIEGEVQVEAPWRLHGSPAYRLGAKERKAFALIFAPVEPGVFRSEARFTSRRDRTTALRAECLAVIAVEPASLELRHEPGEPTRRAAFALVNRTDQPRSLRLTASPRLHLPAGAEVAARGRTIIAVEMTSADTAALREEVRIEGAGAPLSVPVRAPAVGPVLRRLTPALAFGRLALGQSARLGLEIENAGGTEGFWKWEVPSPFEADPPEAKLLPGEKRTVAITLRATQPGRYRSWIKVRGEAQTHEIPIEAEVVSSTAAAPLPSSKPRMQRVSTRGASQSAVAAPSDEAAIRLTSPFTGDVTLRIAKQRAGVQIREVRPTSVVLDWPAALTATKDFKVQIRQLSLGAARELKIDWAELRTLRLRTEGDRVVAELKKLSPATAHAIRVLPVAAAGETGPPLFIADVVTPAKPRLREMLTPLRVLLLILAGLLGTMAWRKYRPA